jgi:hypothetical protein
VPPDQLDDLRHGYRPPGVEQHNGKQAAFLAARDHGQLAIDVHFDEIQHAKVDNT